MGRMGRSTWEDAGGICKRDIVINYIRFSASPRSVSSHILFTLQSSVHSDKQGLSSIRSGAL